MTPDKATLHGARILLDVSRLISAGARRTPSGIERVELAYVKHFTGAEDVRFVGYFLGRLHLLPFHLVASYTGTLEQTWRAPAAASRARTISKMVAIYLVMLGLSLTALVSRRGGDRGRGHQVYLNLSHQHLTAQAAIREFKLRMGVRLLCFVHDLIPITHPEYARFGQAEAHCRRMDTVAALADVVLVNSAATKAAFLHYAANRPRLPEVHVAHLGVAPGKPPRIQDAHEDKASRPYFVILATIEPRKNHLLLLNLWRRLAADCAAPPRLIIVGRSGWENEMVLDMLERCEAIAELIEYRRNLPDSGLAPLLQRARALLLPSFAEGFGLPVAEALAAGTPVICSDLPALREIGGDVPEYIDPLDGLAWLRAIHDYAEPASPRRRAQCARLVAWSAPGWERHFEQVAALLQNLTREDDPAR
jgi:glycosyltransferase involved in cell wall biosynthesis